MKRALQGRLRRVASVSLASLIIILIKSVLMSVRHAQPRPSLSLKALGRLIFASVAPQASSL